MNQLSKNISVIGLTLLLSACASTLETYQKKADAGDVQSQFELGINYYHGTKDIPKNEELAIKYLTLASDNGNSKAAFSLGRIYEKNNNLKQAVIYYERAAKENNALALDNLAIIYQYGRGVTKDIEKAEQLFLAAKSNGSELSERNLALLYKQEGKYNQAIATYKNIVYLPTGKYPSYALKKGVALQIMDLNLQIKDYQQAYIWGGVAVLSGVFDGEIKDYERYMADFETTSNMIDIDTQKILSKDIVENHYKIFQQYEPYFSSHQNSQSKDGVVMLSSDEGFASMGYILEKNAQLIKDINYYKTKTDEKSQISLAVLKLRLASSYISYGSIMPNFDMAQNEITEAMTILNKSENKNLNLIKQNMKNKLQILEQVYAYQREKIGLK